MGDPAGIGLEIAIRAWALRRTPALPRAPDQPDTEGEARAVPPFALYADPGAVMRRARRLGLAVEIAQVASPSNAHEVFAGALPVVPIALTVEETLGEPAAENAAATIAAIDRAAGAVAEGQASALVTNPIAKSVLYAAGFRHPGHTEYLAHLAARLYRIAEPRPVMMLAGGGLRVVPLTVHVPLARVPGLVTRELIVETVEIVAAALKSDFGISQPRIAVAGLNPHAGERGTIGREDEDTVAPAVQQLAAHGLRVSGPHSADTLFHAAARRRYDAAVAMYHDQALIPLKTLAFDSGVNITLGLPFVRTSPDHGTAFDIAARACASPESLVAALMLADAMAKAHAASRQIA